MRRDHIRGLEQIESLETGLLKPGAFMFASPSACELHREFMVPGMPDELRTVSLHR